MRSRFNLAGFFQGIATVVWVNVLIVLVLIGYITAQVLTGTKNQFSLADVVAVMGSLSFILISKLFQVVYTIVQLRRYQVSFLWYIGALFLDLWMLPFLYSRSKRI